MREIPLTPNDITFSYNSVSFSITNMRWNRYTSTWSFDLSWGTNTIIGLTISGGVNVVKGHGTPLPSLVFIDYSTTNGDISDVDATRMFIFEEGDFDD